MKKLLLPFAAIPVIALIFSSCSSFQDLSVVKRHYRNGFYVHKSQDRPLTSTITATTEIADVATLETEVNTASIAPEFPVNTSGNTTTQAPVSKSEAPTMKNTGQHAGHSFVVKNETAAPVAIRKSFPANNTTGGSDASLIILVLLAIFLSPIAILLKEGVTIRFWIDLICWLLGVGVFAGGIFYGGGLALFAVIFALLIVLDVI